MIILPLSPSDHALLRLLAKAWGCDEQQAALAAIRMAMKQIVEIPNQEPLGEPFEKILNDNIVDLYVRSPSPADPDLARQEELWREPERD